MQPMLSQLGGGVSQVVEQSTTTARRSSTHAGAPPLPPAPGLSHEPPLPPRPPLPPEAALPPEPPLPFEPLQAAVRRDTRTQEVSRIIGVDGTRCRSRRQPQGRNACTVSTTSLALV